MVDKNYSEAALDPNFLETINLLNENNISYWVCHGSLLGLIRDGNLIPWDHDIDIAVWNREYKKKDILNLFVLAGFQLRDDNVMGSLNFIREGGRTVDINFYTDLQPASGQSIPLVGVMWRVPRSKVGAILDIIFQNQEYKGKHKILYNIVSSIRIIFIPIYKILDKLNLLYLMKGYTTPKSLLSNFIFVNYSKLRCRIPKQSEDILSFIYGEDWRTPIKVYDWTTDSSSVITID